jgi:alkyl sulfatase BDS1-like metallo-beta-lactamase superfamily hydrolase
MIASFLILLIFKENGQRFIIDGLELEFILCPGAEASSEFMFYLPQLKVSSYLLHHRDKLSIYLTFSRLFVKLKLLTIPFTIYIL